MTKKQLIILVAVGLVIFIATFFGVYLLSTNDDGKPKGVKEVKNAIVLTDYIVSYGTYVGVEKEYNDKTGAVTDKEVKMEVTKDKINGESFTVKGNSIYVNGYEMYEVTKDNQLKLLAGSGIDYVLSK